MAVEGLSLSAAQLRESLELCQGVTDEAGALLDACARNLRHLDRAVEPMTGRTLALTRARDNIKKARDNIEEVLDHLDASRKVQGVIQDGPHANNLSAFLAALSKLEAAIEFLRSHKNMHTAADALAHASALRDKAVGAAGGEFAALLARHCTLPPALLALQRQRGAEAGLRSQVAEQDVSGVVVDMLPAAQLPKLRSLAGAMLRNGDKSCIKVYVDARRRVLQQCLEGQLAGVCHNKEDMSRLTWRQVEVKIPGWEAAVKLLSRLVQEEARLCAAIFPPAEQPQVLQKATAPAGRLVVEVGAAILSARRLPDGSSLFGLLDMHDALACALPTLRSAVVALGQQSRLERGSPGMGGAPPPSPAPLPAAADLGALQSRVVSEVQACFDQLQEVYGGKLGEGMPPDATVHPLCASTLATLRRMLTYDSALPVLFGEEDRSGRSSMLGRGGLQEEARLLEHMSSAVTTILDSLLSSLDAKSKAAYRSRAQAALHMMNNAHFMATAVGGRELKAVGEAWLEAHKGLVEQYQQQYMESCWGPLVSLMQADLRQPAPTPSQLEKGGRQAAKDKWTLANKILEGIFSQQGLWTVVDATLRYALKDHINETVLPLYQEFVERYMCLHFTENRSKYIHTSASQLQAFIAHDLFERGAEAGPSAKPSASGASSLFRPSSLASQAR